MKFTIIVPLSSTACRPLKSGIDGHQRGDNLHGHVVPPPALTWRAIWLRLFPMPAS
jgi:hypothetical protein